MESQISQPEVQTDQQIVSREQREYIPGSNQPCARFDCFFFISFIFFCFSKNKPGKTAKRSQSSSDSEDGKSHTRKKTQGRRRLKKRRDVRLKTRPTPISRVRDIQNDLK